MDGIRSKLAEAEASASHAAMTAQTVSRESAEAWDSTRQVPAGLESLSTPVHELEGVVAYADMPNSDG